MDFIKKLIRDNLYLLGFTFLVGLIIVIDRENHHNQFLYGLFFLSLAGLGLNYYLREVKKTAATHKLENGLLIGAGLLLTFLLRKSLFGFESGDFRGNLNPWYETIAQGGGLKALKEAFADYTPLYLYMLVVATMVPIAKLTAIKLISIIFDYVAAYWVYRLVKLKYPTGMAPIAALFTFLLLPTVVINGSMWAQCDVIFTSGLLATVYFFLREKKTYAMLAFALAFAFKFQSVFLLLPLIALYAREKLEIKHFLLIPLVYVLMILPNYLVGRPFLDLLTIYFSQANSYPVLTLNAPSVYQLIKWAPVEAFDYAGKLFVIAIMFFFGFMVYRKKIPITQDFIMKASMLSLLILPYFLPRMHERYFFAADVFSLVFAFYFPRFFYVPIVVVLVSLFSYYPFLFGMLVLDFHILALALLILIIILSVDFVKSFLLTPQQEQE